MTCASAFQELANRNPFLQKLYDLGYDVDFVGGYVVLYGLPYLDERGAVQYGDICTPVDIGADNVIQPTGTHQCWWRGGKPHARAGVPLAVSPVLTQVQVAPDFTTDFAFSLKQLDGNHQMRLYESFEEKITTYIDTIVPPAQTAHRETLPRRGITRRAAEQGSPLRFPDTSSANYHQNDIAAKLRGKKVAIIGMGGTGSYILDFIARTHLDAIVLFDDDAIHVHTIFRAPGCIAHGIGKPKVEALFKVYDEWHAGITAVPERITWENIERLRGFDFAFVSVDDGPSRRFIADWLSTNGIPFVDCGMGLNRSFGGLNGLVRITGVDRAAYERSVDTEHLPTADPKDAEYRKQAQIAELNALNAAFAVIRFKQHFGLYERIDDAAWHLFETASFELDCERLPQ